VKRYEEFHAEVGAATTDGSWVAGVGPEGLAIWKGDQFKNPKTVVKFTPGGEWLDAWCPDDRTFVAISSDLLARAWSLPEGKPVAERSLAKEGVTGVSRTPDQKKIVGVGKDKVVVLDARSLRTEREGKVAVDPTCRWKPSPSGKYLGVLEGKGKPTTIRVISLQDMKAIGSWPPPVSVGPPFQDFDFNPAETMLAVIVDRISFSVLSVPQLQRIGDGSGTNQVNSAIRFSSDGKSIFLSGHGVPVFVFPLEF
jgi:WD40 repeat protein